MEVRPKVGLVNVCMEVYPHHVSDGLVAELADLVGPSWEFRDYGKVFDMVQAVGRASDILRDRPDMLIILFGTWLDMSVALTLLNLTAELPTVIWTLPMVGGESTGSLVAFAVAKGTLERTGEMRPYVYGLPHEVAPELVRLARGSALRQGLKTARLGLFGYASMGIYTATFNHLLLKQKLGPEVVHVDNWEIVRRMESLDPKEVEATAARLFERYPLEHGGLRESALRSVRMYMVMRQLVDELKLDGVTAKCMFEMSRSIGCACLPLSLLVEEGIPCSDEGDVYAVVTMLLMNRLGGAPAYFADFINADDQNIWFSTCGFIAPSLTQDGVTVRQQVEEVGREGVIFSGKPRTGQVVIARLEEVPGGRGFRMHVARGVVTEGSLRKHTTREGQVLHLFPICRVSLSYPTELFMRNVCANHYILSWHDLYDDLVGLCKALGVQVVCDEGG